VTTLTQLTFFIYKNHHSNEEEEASIIIIIIFIILQFTSIPLLFLVCVNLVCVCVWSISIWCNPSFTKRRILCIGVLNFSTTFGNLLGGQHFHTILCISIFVGCSIFAHHIVHLGSTCWVLNFAQQFVHLGIYWVQMFSPNLCLSLLSN
jgi:hypothetical protein